jgi:hypothetical protein
MTIASIFESLSSSPQVTSIEVADPGVIFRFENGCRLEIHECYWAVRCYMRVNKQGEVESYVRLLATSHDQQGVKEHALKLISGLPISSFGKDSIRPPWRPDLDQTGNTMGDLTLDFGPDQWPRNRLEFGELPLVNMDFHPLKSHESVNWVFVDEADRKTVSTQFHGLERIE